MLKAPKSHPGKPLGMREVQHRLGVKVARPVFFYHMETHVGVPVGIGHAQGTNESCAILRADVSRRQQIAYRFGCRHQINFRTGVDFDSLTGIADWKMLHQAPDGCGFGRGRELVEVILGDGGAEFVQTPPVVPVYFDQDVLLVKEGQCGGRDVLNKTGCWGVLFLVDQFSLTWACCCLCW